MIGNSFTEISNHAFTNEEGLFELRLVNDTISSFDLVAEYAGLTFVKKLTSVNSDTAIVFDIETVPANAILQIEQQPLRDSLSIATFDILLMNMGKSLIIDETKITIGLIDEALLGSRGGDLDSPTQVVIMNIDNQYSRTVSGEGVTLKFNLTPDKDMFKLNIIDKHKYSVKTDDEKRIRFDLQSLGVRQFLDSIRLHSAGSSLKHKILTTSMKGCPALRYSHIKVEVTFAKIGTYGSGYLDCESHPVSPDFCDLDRSTLKIK